MTVYCQGVCPEGRVNCVHGWQYVKALQIQGVQWFTVWMWDLYLLPHFMNSELSFKCQLHLRKDFLIFVSSRVRLYSFLVSQGPGNYDRNHVVGYGCIYITEWKRAGANWCGAAELLAHSVVVWDHNCCLIQTESPGFVQDLVYQGTSICYQSYVSCSIDETKLGLANLPVSVLRHCPRRTYSLRNTLRPTAQTHLIHICYHVAKVPCWRAVNNPSHVQVSCLDQKKKKRKICLGTGRLLSVGLKIPQPFHPHKWGAGPGAGWIWHWQHAQRQDHDQCIDFCLSISHRLKPGSYIWSARRRRGEVLSLLSSKVRFYHLAHDSLCVSPKMSRCSLCLMQVFNILHSCASPYSSTWSHSSMSKCSVQCHSKPLSPDEDLD